MTDPTLFRAAREHLDLLSTVYHNVSFSGTSSKERFKIMGLLEVRMLSIIEYLEKQEGQV